MIPKYLLFIENSQNHRLSQNLYILPLLSTSLMFSENLLLLDRTQYEITYFPLAQNILFFSIEKYYF